MCRDISDDLMMEITIFDDLFSIVIITTKPNTQPTQSNILRLPQFLQPSSHQFFFLNILHKRHRSKKYNNRNSNVRTQISKYNI